MKSFALLCKIISLIKGMKWVETFGAELSCFVFETDAVILKKAPLSFSFRNGKNKYSKEFLDAQFRLLWRVFVGTVNESILITITQHPIWAIKQQAICIISRIFYIIMCASSQPKLIYVIAWKLAEKRARVQKSSWVSFAKKYSVFSYCKENMSVSLLSKILICSADWNLSSNYFLRGVKNAFSHHIPFFLTSGGRILFTYWFIFCMLYKKKKIMEK